MKSVDSFQRKDAETQSPDTDLTNNHQFKCAKEATDISPGLARRADAITRFPAADDNSETLRPNGRDEIGVRGSF